MLKITSQQVKKNRRPLVAFLLGLLAGFSIFLFLFSQQLDSLYLERDAIYFANNQKYKQIQKLEQELNKQAQWQSRSATDQEEKIKKISVEVDSEQRFGTEMIKAQVEALLEPFLDKSMQWVSNNPQLVASVLMKKPIPINEEQNQEVEISIKYLTFYQETMKVWVTIHHPSTTEP